MIWNSEYYKDELNVIADRFAKRKEFKRWTERSGILAEKDIFIAFFYVRKLIEAKTKLSDKTVAHQIKVSYFPPKEKNATLMNNHKIDELFELENMKTASVGLEFLCNQIIHSYIFNMCFGEDDHGLFGFLFCSDFKRNEKLYLIEIDVLIGPLKAVGEDYPVSCRMIFDSKLSDYKVTNSKVCIDDDISMEEIYDTYQ